MTVKSDMNRMRYRLQLVVDNLEIVSLIGHDSDTIRIPVREMIDRAKELRDSMRVEPETDV